MKHLFYTICGLAFCFVISGCASTDEADSVQVAEVTRSVFYAPFYAALAEGYFEEENIEVELTTTWWRQNDDLTLIWRRRCRISWL